MHGASISVLLFRIHNTAAEMARGQFTVRHLAFPAGIAYMRTAGAERAAFRQLGRIRRKPVNRMQIFLIILKVRDRAEEADRVRMGRMVEDIFL